MKYKEGERDMIVMHHELLVRQFFFNWLCLTMLVKFKRIQDNLPVASSRQAA